MAHPDNEIDSEFADRISDLEEIENELLNDNWISTKDRLPSKGDTVLIVRDYRKWDIKRKPYVGFANVGFLEIETEIGGPNALSGYHKLKGIYFSVPAILHPESVTHWMNIPDLPLI